MPEETTTSTIVPVSPDDDDSHLRLLTTALCAREGVRCAAVHLARDDLLVAVATSGMDPAAQEALAETPWPRDRVEADLPPAVDGLHHWAPGRLGPAPPSGHGPAAAKRPTGAGARRGGLVGATIRDTEGILRAMVVVETDQGLEAAERDAVHQHLTAAARMVRTTVEHAEVTERLRLADATRRIAQVAASGTSLDDVLQATAADIVDLFGLVALRARVATAGLPLVQTEYAGPWPPDPEWLDELTDDFACQYWDKQRIAITSTDLVHPSDPPEAAWWRAFLRRAGWSSSALVPLGAGTECFGSLALIRPTGAPPWTGAEASAAFEIGLDLGRVLANTRALERERRLVCELQAVDSYKNRLIGTVSHELRNPLSAIRGNLELLSDAALDPVGRHALDVSQRWAGRMSRVVDNLLHLARTLDDQAPTGTDQVELCGVVRDAGELLADEARHRDVPLSVEVPDEPAHVVGDLDQLSQIVVNLLSNAIKYSPAGRPVRAAVRILDGEAEVTVVDHGIGISQEDQRRLFTEFFRSADPAVHAQPGTGLGLAIVERLVRHHGGRIDLESELGTGTSVRVRLPLAARPAS